MMPLVNTLDRYGLVSRVLHWGMAVLVIGLFGLGVWMRTLDYYHPWYHQAVTVHRGLGVLLFALVWVRLGWHRVSPPPPLEAGLKPWEVLAARTVHRLLYLLLLVIPVLGYLITTADGRGLSVFGWFEIPAILPAQKGREVWAGQWHLGAAVVLMLLVGMHAGAALKHHFRDHGETLRRMLL